MNAVIIIMSSRAGKVMAGLTLRGFPPQGKVRQSLADNSVILVIVDGIKSNQLLLS
jgi:hypothetical protein